MASLRELQSRFAAALRPDAEAAACEAVPVRPAHHLAIYRNNSEWQFHNALSLSFPVLRRRVGAEYFRQLAFQYRERHPSRSGDLHWVGRHFAEFLTGHLGESEYAWLADLAQLEWACERASVSAQLPPMSLNALAEIPADALEGTGFQLQPSLHLGESPYPVASVWIRNQADDAPPLAQELPAECYLVLARDTGLAVQVLDPQRHVFLAALQRGNSLGDAMSASGLDEPGLLQALQFVFAQGLVTGITPAARTG